MQKKEVEQLFRLFLTNKVNEKLWLAVAALIPATFFGILYFGQRALLILFLSVSTAVLVQSFFNKLQKRPIYKEIGFAVFIGLLLGLVLPSKVPLWIPILGSLIAIILPVQIFGGSKNAIFNPIAVAKIFLLISFPAFMSQYLENIFGTIGEASSIAIIIGGLILIILKIIDWRIPFFYLGTVLLISVLLSQSFVIHILSGGILLASFFLAPMFNGIPSTTLGKIIFASGCGILTMLIRFFNPLEAVYFAILLMNITTPIIDKHVKKNLVN